MSHVAAVRVRRQRARQWSAIGVCPAEALGEREQVAHRRLVLHLNGIGRKLGGWRCGRCGRGRQHGHGSRGRLACTASGGRRRGHDGSRIRLTLLANNGLLPLTRKAQQRGDHNRQKAWHTQVERPGPDPPHYIRPYPSVPHHLRLSTLIAMLSLYPLHPRA